MEAARAVEAFNALEYGQGGLAWGSEGSLLQEFYLETSDNSRCDRIGPAVAFAAQALGGPWLFSGFTKSCLVNDEQLSEAFGQSLSRARLLAE